MKAISSRLAVALVALWGMMGAAPPGMARGEGAAHLQRPSSCGQLGVTGCRIWLIGNSTMAGYAGNTLDIDNHGVATHLADQLTGLGVPAHMAAMCGNHGYGGSTSIDWTWPKGATNGSSAPGGYTMASRGGDPFEFTPRQSWDTSDLYVTAATGPEAFSVRAGDRAPVLIKQAAGYDVRRYRVSASDLSRQTLAIAQKDGVFDGLVCADTFSAHDDDAHIIYIGYGGSTLTSWSKPSTLRQLEQIPITMHRSRRRRSSWRTRLG